MSYTVVIYELNITDHIAYLSSYFLGGTCPTLTLTQITLRVCMPVAQVVLSCTEGMIRVELSVMTEVSSVHGPHGPVCQW